MNPWGGGSLLGCVFSYSCSRGWSTRLDSAAAEDQGAKPSETEQEQRPGGGGGVDLWGKREKADERNDPPTKKSENNKGKKLQITWQSRGKEASEEKGGM